MKLYIFEENVYQAFNPIVVFADSIEEATEMIASLIKDFEPRSRLEGWGKGWSIAKEYEITKGDPDYKSYHRISEKEWELVKE